MHNDESPAYYTQDSTTHTRFLTIDPYQRSNFSLNWIDGREMG